VLFDYDSQSKELHVEVSNSIATREDDRQTFNSYYSLFVVSARNWVVASHSRLDSFPPSYLGNRKILSPIAFLQRHGVLGGRDTKMGQVVGHKMTRKGGGGRVKEIIGEMFPTRTETCLADRDRDA